MSDGRVVGQVPQELLWTDDVIDAMDLDSLMGARDILRRKHDMVDNQLGDRNRMNRDGGRLEGPDYFAWRRRAKSAKALIGGRLRRVNARIKQINYDQRSRTIMPCQLEPHLDGMGGLLEDLYEMVMSRVQDLFPLSDADQETVSKVRRALLGAKQAAARPEAAVPAEPGPRGAVLACLRGGDKTLVGIRSSTKIPYTDLFPLLRSMESEGSIGKEVAGDTTMYGIRGSAHGPE